MYGFNISVYVFKCIGVESMYIWTCTYFRLQCMCMCLKIYIFNMRVYVLESLESKVCICTLYVLFICVTWLIHMYDVTHWVTSWLSTVSMSQNESRTSHCICYSYVWRDSFVCTTWLMDTVTWLRMSHELHIYTCICTLESKVCICMCMCLEIYIFNMRVYVFICC